jgi:hypothetical protein
MLTWYISASRRRWSRRTSDIPRCGSWNPRYRELGDRFRGRHRSYPAGQILWAFGRPQDRHLTKTRSCFPHDSPCIQVDPAVGGVIEGLDRSETSRGLHVPPAPACGRRTAPCLPFGGRPRSPQANPTSAGPHPSFDGDTTRSRSRGFDGDTTRSRSRGRLVLRLRHH